MRSFSKNWSLAKIVEEIKTSSSKWLKSQGRAMANFHWQSGYGGFSVGPAELEQVVDYITRQDEHHRGMNFQEEYRKFLKSYAIEYDENYVWD
jgi:hypothetical protein